MVVLHVALGNSFGMISCCQDAVETENRKW